MEYTELINKFYSAFKSRQYQIMQACYAEQAQFSDPVFPNLDKREVCAMWEMLCKQADSSFTLEFNNIKTNGNQGSVDWIASYTFSKTGRKVINKIHADFIFADGKIVKHTDTFSFYKWSKQALGTPGLLLGWTPYLQHKVQTQAKKSLQLYIDKSGFNVKPQ